MHKTVAFRRKPSGARGPDANDTYVQYTWYTCQVPCRKIFEATGVCCIIGGTRYSPLTEIEAQALAFDEIAPSDDCMSYDAWEAVRIVKCVAALKLMRRCPRLLVPVALAA